MPVLAVQLYDFVLAVHIAAVVIAFGATFAYPIIHAAVRRDPAGLAWFRRVQLVLARRLISPGLLIVILAGLYLASKRHAFDEFWVQWSLAAALVIGGVEGAFMIPRYRRLIEGAEADPAAAEHAKTSKQVTAVGAFLGLLVVITIFVMVTKPFS